MKAASAAFVFISGTARLACVGGLKENDRLIDVRLYGQALASR